MQGLNTLSTRMGLALVLLAVTLLAGIYLSGLLVLALLGVDAPMGWDTYLSYFRALGLPEVRPHAGTIRLAGALGFGLPLLAWAVAGYFLLRSAQSAPPMRRSVGAGTSSSPSTVKQPDAPIEPTEQREKRPIVIYTEEETDMRYATPAMAAASLALAACATPSSDKTPPSEGTVTMNTDAEEARPLTNPAEALGRKLLMLIGGLQSKRDLTVARVNTAFGFQVSERPEWPGEYEISLPLSERRIALIRFESPSEHSGALLSFNVTRPVHDRTEPLPLTNVCLEFEPFAAALEKMGYTGEERGGNSERGPANGDWRFYRRKPEHEYDEEELLDITSPLEGAGPVEISISWPRDELIDAEGKPAGGRGCITNLEIEAKEAGA